MTSDEHIYKIINAGQMTWFEADRVTLSKIKTEYLFNAENYLYFRKGEEWLKHLISFFVALADGREKILNLSQCYGVESLQYAQTNIADLINLNKPKCLDWLLLMSNQVDETQMCYEYLEQKLWDSFLAWKELSRPITQDFQILCTGSEENKKHLPMWKAVETKVRFYGDDSEAGSHRFYLHEKGYAIFWRQGEDENTRFYGFEGTEPKVIERLKAIFEDEWRLAQKT